MGMTLAKALTYRKRVATRIEKISEDIQCYNSMDSKREREVDVKALMEERDKLVLHIVALKIALFEGSKPVRKHILMLSELKAKSSFLQNITTQHGKIPSSYRDDPEHEFVAIFRKADVDEMVAQIEKDIDDRQEALERHNYLTQIDIDPIV